MTLTKADLKSLEHVEQLDYMPFDPIVKRTEGTVKENGKIFKVCKIFCVDFSLKSLTELLQLKVSKGAPHVLLKLLKGQDEVSDWYELSYTVLYSVL
jgi:hypothetical protein